MTPIALKFLIQTIVSKTNSSSEKEAHTGEINEVNISHMSKQLARLKEFILSAPEVNKMRVEFLKEELANGRYTIQCQNIASKMFRDIEMA